MIRGILWILVASCCCQEGFGQLKKFYTVKNAESYDTIDFMLKATSGTCFIKPSHHDDPLTIYGNPSFADVNPNFHANQTSRTNFIQLVLEDYNKRGLSHAITYNMFGEEDQSEKNYWKVYLTDDKVYNLNLNYGVGDAHINLSDLAVSRFILESGSADVSISYDEGKWNQCKMDTFAVNVDMGTLVVERMHCSNASYIKAEIGFGNVVLDFSQGVESRCTVKASIGAGQLKILMPDQAHPSVVNYKNSPLCKISLEEKFEKVDDGLYVNDSFDPEANNLLEFDLDVALGNIVFEFVK